MGVVVFSGGTATNSLTTFFGKLAEDNELTYILPISDNGGSTSEILRVLGGPAIGDIRSRIVRIIEDKTLAEIFSYRFSAESDTAKKEWNDIVEGSHPIWKNCAPGVKEMLRSFMIHVQSELLKKNRSSNPFKFSNASLGNLFLTGARMFLGSLDASIELMMRIGRCSPRVHIVPCISTNHTHHIAALLANNEIITGQSQISHPVQSNNVVVNGTKHKIFRSVRAAYIINSSDSKINEYEEEDEEEEYANPVYILPALKNSQLHFDKHLDFEMLPAAVKKIFYINPYGEEIKPSGNPRTLTKLRQARTVVYSIGSLLTSLLPTVLIGNVASTILDLTKTKKILLVNNSYDRESFGLEGVAYVRLIVELIYDSAIEYRLSKGLEINSVNREDWKRIISDVIVLSGGEIKINARDLEKFGINVHYIDGKIMTNEKLQIIFESLGAL